MEPWIVVGLLWLVFGGTHILLTTRRLRSALVGALGPWGFTFLYSIIATVTLAWLIHELAVGYDQGAAGLALGRFPGVQIAGIVVIVAGVVLMIAAFFALPASTLPRLGAQRFEVRGLERVTRHPFFVGIALLGLAHALLATKLVGTVGFGGLALFSIAGALHQDAKLRAELGEAYARYLRATSMVPFGAILAGRQQLFASELPWTGLATGLVLAFALWSVHDSILAREGLWAILVIAVGPTLATIATYVQRRRASSRRAERHAAVSR
jgi:uncharacterized membrane protein